MERAHPARPPGSPEVSQSPPNGSTGMYRCYSRSKRQRDIRSASKCRAGRGRYRISSQGSGEAELMPVRVGEMKETLAPCGVTWRRVRLIAVRDDIGMQSVDIRHVENDATPPYPVLPFRLNGEVQVARSSPKTGERCVLAPADEFEAQRAIEADGTGHIMRGQCNRTDALDHRSDFIPVAGRRPLREGTP